MTFRIRCAAALVASLCVAGPAAAHPHVFVGVAAALLFDRDGKITALRQTWTFDEMYTAFAITGFGKDALDPTRDELFPVAQQNMEDLAAYRYFTVLKAGNRTVAFAPPTDYSAELGGPDKTLLLTFTLPLKTPIAPGKSANLEVYDPSYFTAFTFDASKALTLVDAPAQCTQTLVRPKPLTGGEQSALNESFFTNLLPGTDFGVKLAQRVAIACP